MSDFRFGVNDYRLDYYPHDVKDDDDHIDWDKVEYVEIDWISFIRERICEPKWILSGETQTQEFWLCECGNCGYEFGIEDRSSFPFKMIIDKVNIPNFCPECGAKQKKEVNE